MRENALSVNSIITYLTCSSSAPWSIPPQSGAGTGSDQLHPSQTIRHQVEAMRQAQCRLRFGFGTETLLGKLNRNHGTLLREVTVPF